MVINLKYRKGVKLIILLSPIHVPPISSVAIFNPFGVAHLFFAGAGLQLAPSLFLLKKN